MSKNDLYAQLTSDQLETSNYPKKDNYEIDSDNEQRLSNASFHSLEYSPTGEYNTLNEPISTSLKREFFRIYNKTSYSILPRCFPAKNANLKQWDLWGPLFYTLLLSFFLSNSKNTEEMSKTFVLVFVLMWVGGVVVTVNTILLGAHVYVHFHLVYF